MSRLRKVKMDQRKLMDNANTITDMAKVKMMMMMMMVMMMMMMMMNEFQNIRRTSGAHMVENNTNVI